MDRAFLPALYFFLSLTIVPNAAAKLPAFFETDGVRVCPAEATDTAPPDFSGPACRTIKSWQIDPQNDFIWVKGTITLDDTRGPEGEPLSLFVRAKMASEFYLNGEFVGANGTPGPDAKSETPGLMDAALYPPQSLLRIGANDVVFKASAHHGFVVLRGPLHMIIFDKAGNITDKILRQYWLSLLTLGLFLVGVIYFAITGVRGQGRKRALSFSAICAFAAAQLLTEVFRGLVPYTYPVHDVRLILITVFSSGFGLSVAFHVFSTFEFSRIKLMMTALAAVSLVAVLVSPGFDLKAATAIAIPLTASLIATSVWSFQRRPRAFLYFLSLLVFLAAIFIFSYHFLDVVFFYLVAAFLLFLFIEQGFAIVREEEQRKQEHARANRLELALGQAKEREEASTINIKSAGKMERVSTDQIAQCRGASGYSEIVLHGGREILHSATLAEMEENLPTTFLRVHRSHLVNTAFIKSLKRDPAGTGALILSDGSEVPVSRRVMPKVREALS